MQDALFFQTVLRVTQGPGGSYSHRGSLAVDFGGQYAGTAGAVDKVFAPCDMKVARLRENANGECYLQTVQPVRWANGETSHFTLLLMHTPRFIVAEGETVRQGEHIYTEGGMQGGSPGALTPHVHAEVARGHVGCTQGRNSSGTWVLPGQVNLNEVFFVPQGTTIAAAGGLAWVRGGSSHTDGGYGEGTEEGALETPSAIETEEESSMYRLYEVVFASESRANAVAEFERIAADGGRPGLDYASSDGQWRVGNALMAAQTVTSLLENMAPNRFIG